MLKKAQIHFYWLLCIEIVWCVCFSFAVKHAMIVTEYMENGALDKYLRVR